MNTTMRMSLLFMILLFGVRAHAGVFAIPHFVEPDRFSLGLEPELTLSGGDSGVGVNAKYTRGVSDLLNVMGVVGTGGGPRGFRVGGATIFDFFPDVDGQPGLGVATQLLYYRRRDIGRLELTAIPYIHKAFISGDGSVEPYAALPVGVGFRSEGNDTLMGLAVGAIFGSGEKVRYIVELGINIDDSDTYISGGLTYYY